MPYNPRVGKLLQTVVETPPYLAQAKGVLSEDDRSGITTVVWWYVVCFEEKLQPTGWPAWPQMRALYGWMKERASSDEWSKWVALGVQDRDRDKASGRAPKPPTP